MKTAQAAQVVPREPVKPEPKGGRFRRTIRSWASNIWDIVDRVRAREEDCLRLANKSGLFTKEGPVEVLYNEPFGDRISKTYVGYSIEWYEENGQKNGRYRKNIPEWHIVRWGIGETDILKQEINRFRNDVLKEATDRADIREFLAKHPGFNQPKKLEEKPVEVDLEDGFISKDYGAVCIVWQLEYGFGKWTNEIIGNEFVASKLAHNVKPSEVKKCKEDVLEEAKTRPEVAGFLAKYPEFNQ